MLKSIAPFFPAHSSTCTGACKTPAAVGGTDAEKLAVFRRVRDELRGLIEQFVQETQRVLA